MNYCKYNYFHFLVNFPPKCNWFDTECKLLCLCTVYSAYRGDIHVMCLETHHIMFRWSLWCVSSARVITGLRLTEMRIMSENSVLMLQQPAELAALDAAESAVTAEISGDRSVGTAHCGDYVYYRQTWQLRSARHLSVVSHLASFSGANLPDLTGGSTLWFFIAKVFALTRQPELHPACFLLLTMSAPHYAQAPSWLEGAHFATWRWLLTTIFHLLPLIIE